MYYNIDTTKDLKFNCNHRKKYGAYMIPFIIRQQALEEKVIIVDPEGEYKTLTESLGCIRKGKYMIKCKLKCDKNYGGRNELIDADFINTGILSEIINKFTENGVLEVTEKVIDYYNKNRAIKDHKLSFKTANAIIRSLRKYIKECNK